MRRIATSARAARNAKMRMRPGTMPLADIGLPDNAMMRSETGAQEID